MIALGIDPGARGGLAILDGTGLVEAIRMPILAHGSRTLVDTAEIAKFAGFHTEPLDVIVIELVHSMPKQGVASSFAFGRAAGAVEGWAVSTGLPVNWTTASSWKKRLGLGKDKRASLDAARLHFGYDPRWGVLANDGLAEAALIALDWIRQFGKQG
jgi:crossover junction endodeoxyribonuclease RuvC